MAEDDFLPPVLVSEDHPFAEPSGLHFIVPFEIPIVEKKLSFEEASKCLNTLGKDESGIRYAYLMITATDRKLTDVSVILSFKHVLFVDLSGNFLKLDALQVLANMPYLIMLKANRNRLESANLDTMAYLQVLSLNINKIEETCDIAQPMLETLEIEYNQIFTAQFDSEKLPNLKELGLAGNHLMDLAGTYPESLERLFLNQNKITRLNGLSFSKLANLTTLHLRDNKIRKLNGFSEYFSKLSYLNLRKNNITKLRQFRKLACLPKLEILIFIDNPVDGKRHEKRALEEPGEAENEEEEAYGEDGPPTKRALDLDPIRIGVLALLPNLKRINKQPVTLEERDEAFFVKEKKLGEIMNELSSDDETEPNTTTYTSDVGDTETEGDEMEQDDPRDEGEDEEGEEDN